ncbi:LamG-like jellyroll fold domain-containing protein [Haloferula chungangensis]|uniref:LamG-like jellyroll fold domain-containing protein n=1 Tax=Haloferula chungangensis TaxID=1048331 RepID=A0ABW2L3R8_9BACT
MKAAVAMFLAVFAAQVSFGYEVWFGLPYIPKGSHDEFKDQWEMVAELMEGMNTNTSDAQRPSAERNTGTEWKAIVQCMPKAKNEAVLEFPRTHFQYDGFGGAGKDPLPDALVTKFKRERNLGCQIKWIMPFDNQPGEDRTLPVEEWSDQDLQDLRDWMDNNGHADVRIISNVRNNGARARSFSEKAIVDGVSIEARAELWFENSGSRQDFLDWALANPQVRSKSFKFQVPFGKNGSQSEFQAMRVFMRWLSTDMVGNTDFIRRDDVAFMVITYGPQPDFLPETSPDGSEYENTMFSLALSLIEQRDLFEGRTPVGLISEEQALSYDRVLVTPGPTAGLVAHWPLDEGSGTSTADVSGFGSEASLLNGASWGSDATRGSHVVFDGTDDRIQTAFNYSLSDTDDFTWAWWAKKAPGSHSGSIMVGNRYGGTGSETLEFIKFMSSKAAFANTGSAAGIEDYIYPNQIATSSWNHYAMVKEGTSYRWYVDGVAQGTPVTINYNESSPLPFLIGGDDDGSGSKVNEHFEGCIDDVVLYRSALSAAEVANVIGGTYALTIPMATAALGSPVNVGDGSTWEDGQPPHAGFNYLVPNTGNLRGEGGSSTFPGFSLTVEAGGRFQVRAIEDSGQLNTIDQLVLEGGASFDAGDFVEVTSGTGSSVTNALGGAITNSGFTRFLTYGSSGGSPIDRSLKVSSRIGGSGRIQAQESGEGLSSITIANGSNTFSGTWEVAEGSTLIFEQGGAVGSADVEVAAGGILEIQGDWDEDAMLSVADAPGTEVRVGSNRWTISGLSLGGCAVADGIYTPADLSGLGSADFTGTGTITVGNPAFGMQVVAGWDHWSSGTAPVASVTAQGISTTVTTSSTDGNWSNSDQSNDGRGSSGDGTWGTFDGGGASASSATSGAGANMTALNGVEEAEITLTLTNNGSTAWNLDGFHMDVLAFRPNAPRSYELVVVSGDMTTGSVFESSAEEINHEAGTLPGTHDTHDQIDLYFTELADRTLEVGESAAIRITFEGGVEDSAGHHLFLDNLAISGFTAPLSLSAIEAWREFYFGPAFISGTGIAADSYDANFDGESNLLEFATGQDPHASTLVSTPLTMKGGNLEFRYSRSKAALADGMTFTVEWSDGLLPDSWSSAGVNDSPDPANPGNSEMENRVVTVPAASNGRRFIHLQVTGP